MQTTRKTATGLAAAALVISGSLMGAAPAAACSPDGCPRGYPGMLESTKVKRWAKQMPLESPTRKQCNSAGYSMRVHRVAWRETDAPKRWLADLVAIRWMNVECSKHWA